MTTHRRSTRGRSSGRTRRVPTTWEQIQTPINFPIVAVSSSFDITQQTIRLQENTGGTIIRTIGEFAFFPDTGTALGDEAIVSLGICVVTKDALAAGALPDPSTDLEHDWYYWVSTRFAPVAGGGEDSTFRFKWDIRSSRRLREGYRLVLLAEKEVSEGTFAGLLSMRNLWQLRP